MTCDDEIDDFYSYPECVACPHCMGGGFVACRCGGDQCYCDNHGDAPCPVCHGEGEASEDRAQQYRAAEQEAREAMRKAWEAPQ